MNRTKTPLAVASLAMTLPLLSASAQIFTENFNDGNGASRWSSAYQLESTRDPGTTADGNVDYAFDYGTLGLSNPSGGSDTTGAAIKVNTTDQGPGDEGETYIIFPTGKNFSGNFKLEADLFVHVSGSATTELGLGGLFLDNNNPVAPYQWGDAGGPLAWAYSAEGGSSADLARFAEGNATTTGYSGISDYNDVPAASIPGFQTGGAGSLGPAGDNPNGSWVRFGIEVVGTDINWYLNGSLVDTYDNSGGFYSEDGNVFLGLTDPFNSANGDNVLIIDNVSVIPEPSTYAMIFGLVAGAAIVVHRRRKSRV